MFVSASTASLYGYRVEELIGMPLVDLVAPEAHREVSGVHEQRLPGDIDRYETLLLARGGARVPVEVAECVGEANGEPRVIAVVTDRDEAIKREAERTQLQEVLRFYAGHVVKAQEEERGRMSRELHDGTIQELLMVCHRLRDIAGGNYGKLPKRAQRHLEGVSAFIERIVEEVRSFTRDLRPAVLDDMGLVPALRWLAGGLTNEGTTRFEVHVGGEERRLGKDTESSLFRIVQEAFANVRKHACATCARVVLDFGERELVLRISDDGTGFDMPAKVTDLAEQGKLGLLGLTERVHSLMGQCEIESAPGQGTVVTVRLST